MEQITNPTARYDVTGENAYRAAHALLVEGNEGSLNMATKALDKVKKLASAEGLGEYYLSGKDIRPFTTLGMGVNVYEKGAPMIQRPSKTTYHPVGPLPPYDPTRPQLDKTQPFPGEYYEPFFSVMLATFADNITEVRPFLQYQKEMAFEGDGVGFSNFLRDLQFSLTLPGNVRFLLEKLTPDFPSTEQRASVGKERILALGRIIATARNVEDLTVAARLTSYILRQEEEIDPKNTYIYKVLRTQRENLPLLDAVNLRLRELGFQPG